MVKKIWFTRNQYANKQKTKHKSYVFRRDKYVYAHRIYEWCYANGEMRHSTEKKTKDDFQAYK